MSIAESQSKINIGDAYKLSLGMFEFFGRIVGFDETSACYNGEYAQVIFATPAGSKLKTGRYFLNKIVEKEDFDTLARYEENVTDGPLYDGLIEL